MNILQFLRACNTQEIIIDCFYSLKRVMIGVLLAIVFGILMGLLRSALPKRIKQNSFFRFFLDAPKFPPPIAWIPLIILLFGIGEVSAYTIVFIGAFSPIFTNTFDGAEALPLVIRNTARSLEIRRLEFVFKILLPSALPQILTGIRVGVGMGWMSVIAAEMVSGQSGLGYSIQLHRLNLDYTAVLFDIFLIGLIGFILYEVLGKIERSIMPWNSITRK